jgi:hypothetical protein
MSDQEIERMRNYGKRWIPQKSGGGGGFFAALQDEKINAELRYDRKNVCPKCRVVKAKNGECFC